METERLHQLQQTLTEHALAERARWYVRRFFVPERGGDPSGVNTASAARQAIEVLAIFLARCRTIAEVQQHVAGPGHQWPEPMGSLLIALLATIEKFDATWQAASREGIQKGGNEPTHPTRR